jgi:hypothetical protein
MQFGVKSAQKKRLKVKTIKVFREIEVCRVEAIENKNLEETVLDGASHSGATRDVGSPDVELQLSMFDQQPLLETTIGIGLF